MRDHVAQPILQHPRLLSNRGSHEIPAAVVLLQDYGEKINIKKKTYITDIRFDQNNL